MITSSVSFILLYSHLLFRHFKAFHLVLIKITILALHSDFTNLHNI